MLGGTELGVGRKRSKSSLSQEEYLAVGLHPGVLLPERRPVPSTGVAGIHQVGLHGVVELEQVLQLPEGPGILGMMYT